MLLHSLSLFRPPFFRTLVGDVDVLRRFALFRYSANKKKKTSGSEYGMTEKQGRNNKTRLTEGIPIVSLHSGLPRIYAPEMHNSLLCCVWLLLKRERAREKRRKDLNNLRYLKILHLRANCGRNLENVIELCLYCII